MKMWPGWALGSILLLQFVFGRKIMSVSQELEAVKAQLRKAFNELSAKLVELNANIENLSAALASANVDDENVSGVLGDLRSVAQDLDDLVPDVAALEPVAETSEAVVEDAPAEE